ncbi:MAG: RnfABCDGE type electron transport complex subunit G [Faecalibacillus sp.]
MNSKALLKDALILFIITVISGCLLGAVYDMTKEPIAIQQEETKLNAYRKVMKEADEFKEDYDKVVKESSSKLTGDYGSNGIEITNALGAYKNSELIGYIIQVIDKDGFGGEIEITVGINKEKMITGVEILSIDETVGLGMNAKKEEFRNQYLGKKVDQFKVVKTGSQSDDEIDSLSGATITSKAMTNGINGALDFYDLLIKEGR